MSRIGASRGHGQYLRASRTLLCTASGPSTPAEGVPALRAYNYQRFRGIRQATGNQLVPSDISPEENETIHPDDRNKQGLTGFKVVIEELLIGTCS